MLLISLFSTLYPCKNYKETVPSSFPLFFRYPLFMKIDFKLSFQIIRVIKHVRESLTMMPCFCPKDAIFVLNKWDMIRKEEDKKEFLDIIKVKLHELWEEIEDNNIKTLAAVSFYFSVRKHNVFDKSASPLNR